LNQRQISRKPFFKILLVVVGLVTIFIPIYQSQLASSTRSGSSQPPQRDYWPTNTWQTTSSETQAMDSSVLGDMHQYIIEQLPHVRSALVVRHGYLVFEKYYQGYDETFDFEVASVTKSITSALVGIALQKGYLQSLDQRVIDSFPEYMTSGLDPQTNEITLKQLLTMTAGFDWSEETAWKWPVQNDWLEFSIRMPALPKTPPGQKFAYNTPSVHLLSGVLTKATQTSMLEFADRYLFQPIGIAFPTWDTDPKGYYIASSGLFLKPRDMAKIGFLYLNNGQWDGKEIISADWVKLSTQMYSEGGFPEYTNYGYLWWVTNIDGYSAYFAAGYGGQLIYVIPDADIVVVITSKLDRPHPENKEIVSKFIIRAIRR
jgi:CubicO group peptidase (beta-lactamase class C family)